MKPSPSSSVGMAPPAAIARRVERILSEEALPMKMGRQQRVLVTTCVLPLAAIAAGAIAQTLPMKPELVADNPKTVSVVELRVASLDPLPINPLQPPRARLPSSLSTDSASAPIGATSPGGQESKPTNAVQPLDMTGTWNLERLTIHSPGGRGATGVPVCSFQQTGNQLTGACQIHYRGGGPVTGTVSGRHVEWRWDFTFYTRFPGATSHAAASDQFAVTTFKGELDSPDVLNGRYQSEFHQGWLQAFFAKKVPGPPDFIP